jgi:hypothetical protein
MDVFDRGSITLVFPHIMFMSLSKSVVLEPTVTKLKKSYSGHVMIHQGASDINSEVRGRKR